MDHTVEIYEAEKELREKRLAAYAEAIQKKVQRDSEQIIKELVEPAARPARCPPHPTAGAGRRNTPP